MAPSPDCRVACGSSVVKDPCEGHISVMIPYEDYRRMCAFLNAIESPGKPEEMIVSVLEDWLERHNL